MPIRRYVSQLKAILGPQELRPFGTEVYSTTIPSKVRPAEDDMIITAGDTDRLDSLASKFYGSPTLWYVIASVNNIANGKMHVTPGSQLRIPNRNRVVG